MPTREHASGPFSIPRYNYGIVAYASKHSQSAALDVLACIGNEIKVVSRDAKGAKGYIIGKHVSFMVWLNDEDQKKINIGDKIQVKACGVGLKIEGFEETVRVNKIDPDLLEKMGIIDRVTMRGTDRA
jgi:hypothetical protein